MASKVKGPEKKIWMDNMHCGATATPNTYQLHWQQKIQRENKRLGDAAFEQLYNSVDSNTKFSGQALQDRVMQQCRTSSNWNPDDESEGGQQLKDLKGHKIKVNWNAKKLRPDLGDIFTLGAPFSPLRPAPLPLGSTITINSSRAGMPSIEEAAMKL